MPLVECTAMYANEGPFVNLKANSVVGFFKSPWEGGVRRRDSWKDSRQRFLEEINASYSIGGGGEGGGKGRRSRGTKRVR